MCIINEFSKMKTNKKKKFPNKQEKEKNLTKRKNDTDINEYFN